MDLKRTAREVLENVGGEENIISIMSCFTRVRVELKDKTKVDEKKLKEADGCQGVNWVGNTVQIIFGGRCNDVYDELEKIVHITETEANGEKSIVKKQSVWAVVIDYIANSIQPVVPILIASGFLQSVLAMLNYLDIDTTTYTYQVLNSIGQAGYYFLPIFLAFAAAKKLRINPYLGALVGAVMVYPAIIEAGSAGGTASFFGSAGYACILCVINYSYFDFYAGCHVDQQTSKKNQSQSIVKSFDSDYYNDFINTGCFDCNRSCGNVDWKRIMRSCFVYIYKDVGCRRAAYRRGCAVSCFDRRS